MKIEYLATLQVDENLRKKFQSSELAKDWRAKYPEIFDDDDLRLALSQPKNHFYEWFAAIYLFEEMGYYSLIEKYQYKNHKQKQSIVKKLDFEDLRKVMDYQHWKNQIQLPDLLAYRSDFSDWFFCEVKGGSDRLRLEQEEQFELFSSLSGKPIYLIQINLIRK